MDVERIKGPGGQKPIERKQRESTPDSEEFREMMRTGKVGETEFDKPKKRKFTESEEEKSKLPTPPKSQPPTMPGPYDKFPKAKPPPEEGYPEIAPLQEPQDDQKTKEKKKQEKKEEAAFLQKSLLEEKKALKKEEEKIKKVKQEVPKSPTAPKEKKVVKEEIPTFKETKEKEEERKKTKTIETKPQVSSVLQEFAPNIATQTSAITSTLTPYLHPDVIPLFEKMIGTIIQIQAQGVTQTEVMLNSEAFTSSIFFGSSIVVQKYATAPDSFNIFLRGPTQAVNMFSENLDGLLDAFKKAKINIGRLEAEHEKPLFKRKEKTKEKGNES